MLDALSAPSSGDREKAALIVRLLRLGLLPDTSRRSSYRIRQRGTAVVEI
jgi:hypothetical protein